jgi:spore maturation protein SpmA
MLNYIWGGLIISSLLFALGHDFRDLSRDRYRNDQPLPVHLAFPEGYDPGVRRVPVEIRIDRRQFADFYRTEEAPAESYAGYLLQTQEGIVLRFAEGSTFPEPLRTIAQVSKSRDDELQGELVGFAPPAAPPVPDASQEAPVGAPPPPLPPGGEPQDPTATPPALTPTVPAPGAQVPEAGQDPPPPLPEPDAQAPAAPPDPADAAAPAAPLVADAAVQFEPVRFVKLNAISAAALSFAGTAAEIALGLIGVLALFLGLLKIAEEAGIIYALVKLVRPILRPLFPEVPADHPALGMIALNLTANVFGLGNAATPFGIKAMEELQKLNPTSDTATNPMVMLLAMNTASVQLVPPVLLLALMGLQINQLIFAIIITTGLSLAIAIVSAKLYGRLPGFRASDPNRNPPPAGPGAPAPTGA